MKLSCACGQTFEYDHTKAGQQFECAWCRQTITMPAFKQLSPDDQETYQNELRRRQEKVEKQRQKEEARVAKERDRIAREKARIEANQRHPANQGEAGESLLKRVGRALDFKFERYLTPWIIRRVWLWAVILAAFVVSVYVAVGCYNSLPERRVVEVDKPHETLQAISRIQTEIFRRELEERTRPQPRFQPSPEPTREPVRERPPEPKAAEQPDPYGEMTLEQLRKELARLQEPEFRTEWIWSFQRWALLLFSAIAIAAFLCLLLLWLRVVCEAIIVVFNIATTLTDIKHSLEPGNGTSAATVHQ